MRVCARAPECACVCVCVQVRIQCVCLRESVCTCVAVETGLEQRHAEAIEELKVAEQRLDAAMQVLAKSEEDYQADGFESKPALHASLPHQRTATFLPTCEQLPQKHAEEEGGGGHALGAVGGGGDKGCGEQLAQKHAEEAGGGGGHALGVGEVSRSEGQGKDCGWHMWQAVVSGVTEYVCWVVWRSVGSLSRRRLAAPQVSVFVLLYL